MTDEEFELLIEESLERAASVDLDQRSYEFNGVYRNCQHITPDTWYVGVFDIKDDLNEMEREGTESDCCWSINFDVKFATPEEETRGLSCPA
jgi:hypothetical protein